MFLVRLVSFTLLLRQWTSTDNLGDLALKTSSIAAHVLILVLTTLTSQFCILSHLGANFFGEIVEWTGFAIASQAPVAFAFAFFTFCNIGPRALEHHRWYQNQFVDYPKNRKALIPFFM